jgi:5-methylcytosine-specific restriction endonuclease McrA
MATSSNAPRRPAATRTPAKATATRAATTAARAPRRPAPKPATKAPADPRKTRQWVKLRDQVVLEEPECRLRLPGCTITSTTADHIQPFKTHPELGLERSNLRGACQPCNKKRGAKPDEQLPVDRAKRPRALDIFRPLNEL